MSKELTREEWLTIFDMTCPRISENAEQQLRDHDAALRERLKEAEADYKKEHDAWLKLFNEKVREHNRHAALFAAVKKINKGMICYCGMGETCDKHLLRAALDGDE